nr:PspA/IM30 family protein [Spirochaetales bacterium]
MKHIRRFKDIIHANVNSALDRAENPEKMIRFMLQEMEESLTELKSSCTSKIADRARTEQELAQLQEAVARWNNRAELAVEKGKDSLA